MAHEFRLLETGFHTAAFNMGLDEALLGSVAEGKSLPTLRFYGWKPPAVSIGYFQGLHEEVDVDACRAAGVDVVRRITGGGAVFHHYEVTYSIVVPLSHQLARPNILDSYRLLLGGIIDGLALLGIEAEFAPINDIVTGGKKISGNAQTRKR
ncbi:MAG TPA: lipoate--protein ligase family protein, partial [Spirochaetaceae bacterium]|nr:lipoate--protein ligase family protein [Spirochaetaceae bacterium]